MRCRSAFFYFIEKVEQMVANQKAGNRALEEEKGRDGFDSRTQIENVAELHCAIIFTPLRPTVKPE